MSGKLISHATMGLVNASARSRFGVSRNQGPQPFWIRDLKSGKKRCKCCKDQIVSDRFYVDSILGDFDSLECFVEYAELNRNNLDSLFPLSNEQSKKAEKKNRRRETAETAVQIATWLRSQTTFLS